MSAASSSHVDNILVTSQVHRVVSLLSRRLAFCDRQADEGRTVRQVVTHTAAGAASTEVVVGSDADFDCTHDVRDLAFALQAGILLRLSAAVAVADDGHDHIGFFVLQVEVAVAALPGVAELAFVLDVEFR